VHKNASELLRSGSPNNRSISAIAGTGVLAAASYSFFSVSDRVSVVNSDVVSDWGSLKWFLIWTNVIKSLSAGTKAKQQKN
jgi:hypothetical protein